MTEQTAKPARKKRGKLRLAGAALLWAAVVLIWLIDGLSLFILSGRSLIMLLVVGLLFGAMLWKPRKASWSLVAGAGLFVFVLLWRDALGPSNDRDWWDELAVMPEIKIHEGVVTIEGVRNFTWDEDGRTGGGWETRTYRLENLRNAELIVEPFPYSELMAHTMLGFDFGPDGRLVLSIEARKEKGENYGPIPGALNQFELLYCFLDERDAFTVRAVTRGARLHAYPTRTNPQFLRDFFVDMAEAADGLRSWPRFYHIIFDNCTTVWIREVDRIAHTGIGLRWDTVLNGRLARFMYDHDSIETDLTFEEARERFRIDEQVRAFADHPDFSEKIRRGE